MTRPELSIVIVNWNTRDLLRDCLRSLPAATGPRSCEVIVVDNASGDGSPEMVAAEFPAVTLLPAGGNLGFARANNLALPRARGAHLLLLNPDTVCPPGSVDRLLACAEAHPGHGGYGPLLTDADGRPTITCGNFPARRLHWLRPLATLPLGRRWRRWAQFTHVPSSDEPAQRVDYVAGACLLVPRAAYEAVGPLDDRFFLYFEETDWCLRAWRQDRPILLCPDAAVVHLEGRAAELVSRFSLQQFQASYRRFVAKHHGPAAVPGFRLAIAWEKSLLALRHALQPWSRRHRALARRYAFEARLQLQADITPTPPA